MCIRDSIHLFSRESKSIIWEDQKKTRNNSRLKIYIPEMLLRESGPYLNEREQLLFRKYIQAAFDADLELYISARADRDTRKASMRKFIDMLDIDHDRAESLIDLITKRNYRYRAINNTESVTDMPGPHAGRGK